MLQGADSGAPAAATQLIRSDQGTPVSGALAGGTAVLFPDDPYVAITSTSFVVPSAGIRVLITGLVPGAAYSVGSAATAAGRRFTLTAGGSSIANALGVLDLN